MTLMNRDMSRFGRRPLGLCAILTALVGVACEDPAGGGARDALLDEIGADNVIFGLVSYMTSEGVREGLVRADTAYVFNDSSKLVLRRLHITFYDEDGRERATVTALDGELKQGTDEMVARGDVVLLVRTDGRRIETQELFYDPGADRIWSDSATVMTEADGVVTRGTAFESDIEFERVRVENIRGGGNVIF